MREKSVKCSVFLKTLYFEHPTFQNCKEFYLKKIKKGKQTKIDLFKMIVFCSYILNLFAIVQEKQMFTITALDFVEF